MGWTSSTRARAKINLTLHIRGRLENGYHDLVSLVGFADYGDDISLVAGDKLSLTIGGPHAPELHTSTDNHIVKAASALQSLIPDLRVGHFHLIKRLPVASGIGGGSADAAAALRLLAKLNSLSVDDPRILEAALTTGADVPVCLNSRARIMRGIGELLDVPLILPPLFAVLANPRVATSTPDVFYAIGLQKGERSSKSAHDVISGIDSASEFITFLQRHTNDMEAAAVRLVPEIAELRMLLEKTSSQFVRMSGSGATMFALYADCRSAARAAKAVRAGRPDYWVVPTRIR